MTTTTFEEMKLAKIQQYAIAVLKLYLEEEGYSVGTGPGEWYFEYNRGVRQIGLCNYRKRRIFLSRHFALTLNFAEIDDTIRHEVAHVLTPGEGHGSKWKRKAVEVGAKPNRTACIDKDQRPEPKYYIAILSENEQVEVVKTASCNRRLKNIDNLYLRGRRGDTIGKMWLVESKVVCQKKVISKNDLLR